MFVGEGVWVAVRRAVGEGEAVAVDDGVGEGVSIPWGMGEMTTVWVCLMRARAQPASRLSVSSERVRKHITRAKRSLLMGIIIVYGKGDVKLLFNTVGGRIKGVSTTHLVFREGRNGKGPVKGDGL